MNDIIDFLKACCLVLFAVLMVFGVFSWREYNKRLTIEFKRECYWDAIRKSEYNLRIKERAARERAMEEKREEMYKKRIEKRVSHTKERR